MIIVLEGNVGVGKTTLKTSLISHIESISAGRFEVVDVNRSWDNSWDESNTLQFVDGALKYIYNKEMYALQKSSSGRAVVVMERSVASNTDVFAQLAIEDLVSKGEMKAAQYIDLVSFEYLAATRYASRDHKNVLRIYMRCEPEVCKKRDEGRDKKGRKSKDGFPTEYYGRLHDLYESLLTDPSGHDKATIVLDTSSSLVKTCPMSVTSFGDGSSSLGDYITDAVNRAFPV